MRLGFCLAKFLRRMIIAPQWIVLNLSGMPGTSRETRPSSSTGLFSCKKGAPTEADDATKPLNDAKYVSGNRYAGRVQSRLLASGAMRGKGQKWNRPHLSLERSRKSVEAEAAAPLDTLC